MTKNTLAWGLLAAAITALTILLTNPPLSIAIAVGVVCGIIAGLIARED